MTLQEFRERIKVEHPQAALRKHVFDGVPVCFGGSLDQILKLKTKISDHFGIHPKDLEIVGSAKLGFSLNPDRLGTPFCEKSDIDVMLISDKMFDQAWNDLLKMEFDWYKLKEAQREELKSASVSISRGFISPDRLPAKMPFSRNWWEIFTKLSNDSNFGNRKIRGRLFKNWWFAEKYYSEMLIALIKGV